jgi:hypothetical protein
MNEIAGKQSKKPAGQAVDGLLWVDSRGDKTAIELFVAGIRGWEAGIRRRMDDGKSKPD